VCPTNIGGCGKRFRWTDVEHRTVVTKTTRHPATGERSPSKSETSCPAYETKPLMMPVVYTPWTTPGRSPRDAVDSFLGRRLSEWLQPSPAAARAETRALFRGDEIPDPGSRGSS
jgi:hypothetical protein